MAKESERTWENQGVELVSNVSIFSTEIDVQYANAAAAAAAAAADLLLSGDISSAILAPSESNQTSQILVNLGAASPPLLGAFP